MKNIFITLITLILLSQNVYSGTIKVPQDVTTIQADIDSSSSGDTVIVSPGTYYENINFNGKNIVLGSLFLTTGDTSYISQTVIDGSQQGCVVVFENGEDSTTTLTGFTITNGYSNQDSLRGGGITCINSSNPRLTNLIVADNKVDGNGEAYGGGGIYCLQRSSPILKNIYIQNNIVNDGYGGGIYLRDSSNIDMTNLTVKDNKSERERGGGIAVNNSISNISNSEIRGNHSHYGGGIYADKATLKIDSSKIKKNVASKNGRGGGIWAYMSNIQINNSTIDYNEAIFRHSSQTAFMSEGGGLFLRDCSVIIENSKINHNISEQNGGGITTWNSNLKIFRSSISNNNASINRVKTSGGGINVLYSLNESKLYMEEVLIENNYSGGYGGGISFGLDQEMEVFNKVIIRNNSAGVSGGGISTYSNLVITDSSKCSIYLNKARESGNDILMWIDNPSLTKQIYLDTVTVSAPNDYQINPINNIDLQYGHALYQTIDSDLYVSSEGSDQNSGISLSEPLKTINRALLIAYADSLHPRIINIADGFYSQTVTGEKFPIYGRSYVTLKGENVNSTILDGDGKSRVIEYSPIIRNSSFKNLTIQHGNALERTTIYGEVIGYGGGVYGGTIAGSKDGVILFDNITVRENQADYSGGGLYLEGNVELYKVIISNNILNTSSEFGGGAGLYISGDKAKLVNSTIINNSVSTESSASGGLSIGSFMDVSIINSIFWNNYPNNISIISGSHTPSINVAFSDIQDGEEGIITKDSVVVYWLEGNIDADPLFVGGSPFDYNLTDSSPCINAGTPFFVWEGDTLINLSSDEYIGEAPDMGALESDVLISVEGKEALPTEFKLEQNYPNPFNPITTIQYQISQLTHPSIPSREGKERSERGVLVTLKIYDILGREVTTLVNKEQQSGYYEVHFNASELTSGIYFYRLKTNGFSQSKKFVLIK